MESITTEDHGRKVVNAGGLTGTLQGHPDSRPPLLLLHGLTFDRRIWEPVLDGLRVTDPDRQVLALDLPGHGDSPGQLPHSLGHVTEVIRAAVVDSGLATPVVVGHSLSGGLASIYAGRYPARGVVNLDAAPDLTSFANMLQSMAEMIRGADFPQVWALMFQSFRTELLPVWARNLVAANSQPDQDLVLGYWTELLEGSPDKLTDDLITNLHALAATGVPYLLIAGAEPSPEASGILSRCLPEARVEVWESSGHFPHLAHLDRFLRRLSQTGQWRAAGLSVGDPRQISGS